MIAGTPRVYLKRPTSLCPLPVSKDHPPWADIEFGDLANYTGHGEGGAFHSRGSNLDRTVIVLAVCAIGIISTPIVLEGGTLLVHHVPCKSLGISTARAPSPINASATAGMMIGFIAIRAGRSFGFLRRFGFEARFVPLFVVIS